MRRLDCPESGPIPRLFVADIRADGQVLHDAADTPGFSVNMHLKQLSFDLHPMAKVPNTPYQSGVPTSETLNGSSLLVLVSPCLVVTATGPNPKHERNTPVREECNLDH